MTDLKAMSELLSHALELQRQGQLREAEAVYGAILRELPGEPDVLYQRGVLLLLQGRYAEAQMDFERVLARQPVRISALSNLGYVLQVQAHYGAALGCYERALSLQPGLVELWNNRGLVLKALGRIAEALKSYEQALARRPGFAEAHYNRGLALQSQEKLEDALASFEQAIRYKPDYAEAFSDRGAVLRALGRFAEARVSCQRAVALAPAYAVAHNNLGVILQDMGFPTAALASYARAVQLDSRYVDAHYNMGNCLMSQRDFKRALTAYDRALTLDPTRAETLNNRGNALKDLYRIEESQQCYERALAIKPEYAEAFSNKLLGLLYRSSLAPGMIHLEHLQFGERFGAPLRPLWPRHQNSRDPERRLKVGYVSGDLRNHSVAYFLEGILARHDQGEVEVYAYSNALQEDTVTVRFRGYVNHWRGVNGWTDERLARQILDDGIDVLVDLSGHTAGNRLLTFARKPAPVQATYLGYAATTGLRAIDWRLTHADVDPAGYEAYYSEQLYRLPGSLWCYRPSPELGEGAAEPPLIKQGYVTFGSMNNLAKVSPETITVWARILHALPDARLVMTSVPAGGAAAVSARFAEQGLAPERLKMHDKLSPADYRAMMREIDLALDPFPYNGTTTTCDTLWQGIPVVTLTGASGVSRSGYALLKAVGLEELACQDETDYVRLAVALASDAPRLRTLRAGMRARIESSPLRDEAGSAQAFEAAYRHMWRTWCEAGS